MGRPRALSAKVERLAVYITPELYDQLCVRLGSRGKISRLVRRLLENDLSLFRAKLEQASMNDDLNAIHRLAGDDPMDPDTAPAPAQN